MPATHSTRRKTAPKWLWVVAAGGVVVAMLLMLAVLLLLAR